MVRGLSLASVVQSYFMVSGGALLMMMLGPPLRLRGEPAVYLLLAIGPLLGGAFARLASRGQSILEPGLGAIALVATLAAISAAVPPSNGWLIVMPGIGPLGIAGLVVTLGAFTGAYLAERRWPDPPTSRRAQTTYTVASALGAIGLAIVSGTLLALSITTTRRELALVMLIAIALGGFVAGYTAGSLARARPLDAGRGTALGALACTGLAGLVGGGPVGGAVVGGLVSMVIAGLLGRLGAAIGWSTIGRRRVTWTDVERLAREFQ